MTNPTRSFALIMAALSLLGGMSDQACASTILWDYSPTTTGAQTSDGWSNLLTTQSFAESIHFTGAIQVTGMDIYTSDSASIFLGDSATIRLWGDASGQPSSVLSKFTEIVSALDTDGAGLFEMRVHVDFTSPLNLAGGVTYWIGLTGTDFDFGQSGLVDPGAPNDSTMAQFNGGDTFSYFTSRSIGDMAFRLEGTAFTTVVPEPSTFVTALVGALVGIIALARRRTATAA